jgi:hypothetical protein
MRAANMPEDVREAIWRIGEPQGQKGEPQVPE